MPCGLPLHPRAEVAEEAMRTLDEILVRARAELRTNSTIEVYDFDDGEEWMRRAANPWPGINGAMRRLGESLKKAADSFASFTQAYDEVSR